LCEDERFGQVVEAPSGGLDLAQGTHTIELGTSGRRRKDRDAAPPVRDLDRLALFDASQELAGPLPEFPDPDRCHVLLIAHTVGSGQAADCLRMFRPGMAG
jgi:hypothetical protein